MCQESGARRGGCREHHALAGDLGRQVPCREDVAGARAGTQSLMVQGGGGAWQGTWPLCPCSGSVSMLALGCSTECGGRQGSFLQISALGAGVAPR